MTNRELADTFTLIANLLEIKGEVVYVTLAYRKAAESGDADACYSLGEAYEQGGTVAVNYAKAMHWYGLAAEQDHADALHAIGSLYDNGRGVAQNTNSAVDWYRKAAENGYAGSKALRRPSAAH